MKTIKDRPLWLRLATLRVSEADTKTRLYEAFALLQELVDAPSVPDMPLSMEQFGGLVGLARDDAIEKAIVYKATNIYGETCYFGVKSTAQAWAKSGSVEEVRLRDLRVVAAPTPAEPPADVARDAELLDWLTAKCVTLECNKYARIITITVDSEIALDQRQQVDLRGAIKTAIEREKLKAAMGEKGGA